MRSKTGNNEHFERDLALEALLTLFYSPDKNYHDDRRCYTSRFYIRILRLRVFPL